MRGQVSLLDDVRKGVKKAKGDYYKIDQAPPTLAERANQAREACLDHIEFYQKETDGYSRYYHWLVILTLSGSALTPILLLSHFLNSYPWLQALPSAIGGLAAAINAAFRFRQQWAEAYFVRVCLDAELDRFDLSGNLTEEALRRFQDAMTSIVISEVRSWRDENIKQSAESHSQ